MFQTFHRRIGGDALHVSTAGRTGRGFVRRCPRPPSTLGLSTQGNLWVLLLPASSQAGDEVGSFWRPKSFCTGVHSTCLSLLGLEQRGWVPPCTHQTLAADRAAPTTPSSTHVVRAHPSHPTSSRIWPCRQLSTSQQPQQRFSSLGLTFGSPHCFCKLLAGKEAATKHPSGSQYQGIDTGNLLREGEGKSGSSPSAQPPLSCFFCSGEHIIPRAFFTR